MRIAIAFCLVANSAVAQSAWAPTDRDLEVLDALGGYGCTLGYDSLEGLVGLGIAFDDVQGALAKAQAAGAANWQGRFVVLSEEVCTIRLPEIESRWSPSDPEILASAPFTREEYTLGDKIIVDEGCFLTAGMDSFVALNDGDEEAGYRDYMAFMAAGLISGEVRMYSDDPLSTPPGLQLMTGDCADLPNIDEMQRSHDVLVDRFGAWVRQSYEASVCGDWEEYGDPMFAIRAQGVDPAADVDSQPAINALLGVEWMIITVGAGWREGDTANEKGIARPPLCHYR